MLRIMQNNLMVKKVIALTDCVNLTGLGKYSRYKIFVLASSAEGDGPASEAVIMRTDQDSKFVYD